MMANIMAMKVCLEMFFPAITRWNVWSISASIAAIVPSSGLGGAADGSTIFASRSQYIDGAPRSEQLASAGSYGLLRVVMSASAGAVHTHGSVSRPSFLRPEA